MRHINIMFKPASGRCNLRCEYCFYADIKSKRGIADYGMMSSDTAQKIILNTFAELSRGDRVCFSFQGGEPTLAGLAFFRDFFAFAAQHGQQFHIEFSLQTNGMLLDEQWNSLLRKYDVLVGLSLDIVAEVHDHFRRDTVGGGTFARVMRAKGLLDAANVRYNLLTVLTARLARHPQKIWQFLQKKGIEYVQFIPCLDHIDAETRASHALEPHRFYKFYAALYSLWERAALEGEYISIKLFDDLFNFYTRGIPTACGINGICGAQLVVEADGSAFPCDFYMLDQYKLGSLADMPLELLNREAQTFISAPKSYWNDQPCLSCQYKQSCGGGCKRMHSSMYVADGVCYYAKLLDEILPRLMRTGAKIASGRKQ